jgi:hypothetical protein
VKRGGRKRGVRSEELGRREEIKDKSEERRKKVRSGE